MSETGTFPRVPSTTRARREGRLRRTVRIVGTTLLVLGVGVLVWALTVWLWQDPFTALYTRYQQHKLAAALEREFADPHNRPAGLRGASLRDEERAIALAAAGYRRRAEVGQAIGRIAVPRLGLHMVVVNGTDHDSLTKGPGRDLRTFMPGQGRLVYIAGHRTTYLAPFAHIERMRRGDRITLEMPYATFVYVVSGHRIVSADDLDVLKSRGHEQLELQACHPRFFATHRYIVFARPVRVEPRDGAPFRPSGRFA
jgi:sortase A